MLVNTWFVKWYNIGIGVQHPIYFNILVYHYKINVLKVLYQKYEAVSMLSVTLPSQYESEKVENLVGQNGLQGLQMVQFECPRHPNPSVSSNFKAG